ncbi:MAG: hypothetical protein AABY22_14835 [Nanoarchaeota archaeon]
MKIESIAFFVIVAFSIFGLFILSNLIHELSHKQDYRDFVRDDNICLLVLPKKFSLLSSAALYSYTLKDLNSTEREEYQKINRVTEFKAYLLDIILAIIFITCLCIILINRKINKGNSIPDYTRDIQKIHKDLGIPDTT